MKRTLGTALAAALLVISTTSFGQAGAGAGPGAGASGGTPDRGTGNVAPRTDHPGPGASGMSAGAGMSPRCDGLSGADLDRCRRGSNASGGASRDTEPKDTGVTSTNPPDRGVEHSKPGRRVP